MFSCSARGFWEVYELPVRVTNQLVVEPVPCVRQLEALLEEHERIGVLLTDRQRARMFVFELGELVEHSERLDQLARKSDDDRGERLKTRQGSQLSEQYHQHVKAAAQLAFDVYQRVGFEHFVVGAPVEVRADLDTTLHPYLRARLAEPVPLPVQASEDQVRRVALRAGGAHRAPVRGRAGRAAPRREGVGRQGRHRSGADAQGAGRAPGRPPVRVRGLRGRGLALLGAGASPRSGAGARCARPTWSASTDVVELAVAGALAKHARVEVCIGNADLDVLGRIGALLRY